MWGQFPKGNVSTAGDRAILLGNALVARGKVRVNGDQGKGFQQQKGSAKGRFQQKGSKGFQQQKGGFNSSDLHHKKDIHNKRVLGAREIKRE